MDTSIRSEIFWLPALLASHGLLTSLADFCCILSWFRAFILQLCVFCGRYYVLPGIFCASWEKRVKCSFPTTFPPLAMAKHGAMVFSYNGTSIQIHEQREGLYSNVSHRMSLNVIDYQSIP